MQEKIKRLISSRLLQLMFFMAIFLASLLLTEKFSQSFHFVDEDDHLVFAYYINQGYQLYTDLSSNHQPLVYFLSALSQKILRPGSLFMLLRRSREAVFLYSSIWGLVLLWQFGWVFLATALVFELTKFFIFGDHLLAENLAVYPLIYILGMVFKAVFFKGKSTRNEALIFGLVNFLIAFNLLPLLPSVLVLDVFYWLKTKKIKEMLWGFFIPVLVLFCFISPWAWFKETIFNNLKYVIPQITLIRQKSDYLRFFIFPFLYFFQKDNFVFNHFIRLFSVVTGLNFLLLLKLKKKRQFLKWLFLFFLVMFLNNRVPEIKDIVFYGGFHLLPWYASFIFFSFFLMKFIWLKVKGKVKLLPFLILVVIGSYWLGSEQMPYFQKISKDREHNINYYPYYLTNQAIKVASKKDDRLMVIPDESLNYWQAGVKPATRQIVYYEWAYWVPELKKDFDQTLINHPPEFIYADFKRIGPASYLEILEAALAKDYWQTTRDGLAQNLYMSKEKVREIREEQWQNWVELGFDQAPASEIE